MSILAPIAMLGYTARMDEAAMIVLALRLLAPLLILRFPLVGVLISASIDVADYSFMGNIAEYQLLDKLLDTYYLSLAALTVIRWKDGWAKKIALGAYAWRVLGIILILLLDQRWLLMAFPNFFEPLFVFYLLYTYLSKTSRLFTSGWVVATVVTTLLIPKLVQEYILHIYQPAPNAAPAWVTYIVDHFAWAAIPLYIVPPLIVLGVCIVRARTTKKSESQKSS
jgi:hypothetical protein